MQRITRLQAWACRSPVARPVETSFGVMRDRPAVFLRLEDDDGAFGWGEVFANWPASGAEHRVNLAADDVASVLFGIDTEDPPSAHAVLTKRLHIRALQCGEPGPFAQVVAAIDQALWDMRARRMGIPLVAALGAQSANVVPAYASGIHVDQAAQVIPEARAAGFTGFKVKVGFDTASEPAKLREIGRGLLAGERLFADANQAWTVESAAAFIEAVADLDLGWIEEPLRADAPAEHWQRLAALGVPLAAGENIAGRHAFDAAIADGALRVLQPDLAKWGGISACRDVARAALSARHVYCPHFLGGGLGLMASAHLLAAVGGPGLLEVDVNPNPLRDAFFEGTLPMNGGKWTLSDLPGLGVATLPPHILPLITHTREARP